RRHEAFVLVARIAEARAVAPTARHWIGRRLERMAPEKIIAMDELGHHALGELDLDRHRDGLGVAIGAVGLIVALRARLRRAARGRGVTAYEIALVREIADRPQRKARQRGMAAGAARLRVLPLVLVAGETPVHRWRRRRVGERFGKRGVATLAVFLGELD